MNIHTYLFTWFLLVNHAAYITVSNEPLGSCRHDLKNKDLNFIYGFIRVPLHVFITNIYKQQNTTTG